MKAHSTHPSAGESGRKLSPDRSGPCPGCGSTAVECFYAQDDVPAHSCLLLDDAQLAREFPRGRVRLGCCRRCGLIVNTSFDRSLARYADGYEDSQLFSPRFRAYAEWLADELVARYPVEGGLVLEIGCGTGEFLELVCARGEARGLGVDPGARPRLSEDGAGRIDLVAEEFAERHCTPPPDLVVCRHTLEHLSHPAAFLRTLARGLGDRRPAVVFEVPDAMRILRERAFWDVYYEHACYFTPGSLARTFRTSGFVPEQIGLVFDDQYLVIHARPGSARANEHLAIEESAEAVWAEARAFATTVTGTLDAWKGTITELHARGRRVVLWGSGSKATAFLAGLGFDEGIEAVVDVNPHKQGRFVAGSGHEIVAPDALPRLEPDVVVVMNPAYEDEIRSSLESLGVRCDVLTLR